MSINFQGQNLTPGMHEEFQTVEAELSWAGWQHQMSVGVVLDSATTDAGHTNYTNIIRPGILIGGPLSTGKYTTWDPYGADGSEKLLGVFTGSINMDFNGTVKDRFIGNILVGGSLRTEQVIVPGETDRGLAGTDYEILAREALAGRFVMSDNITYGYKQRIMTTAEIASDTVPASGTLAVSDHNTHFINVGADALTTYNLPAPIPGLRFYFTMKDDQDLVLDGPGTGEFLHEGADAANTVTIDSLVFSTIEVVGARTSAGYQYVVLGNPTIS